MVCLWLEESARTRWRMVLMEFVGKRLELIHLHKVNLIQFHLFNHFLVLLDGFMLRFYFDEIFILLLLFPIFIHFTFGLMLII